MANTKQADQPQSAKDPLTKPIAAEANSNTDDSNKRPVASKPTKPKTLDDLMHPTKPKANKKRHLAIDGEPTQLSLDLEQ